MKVIGTSVSDPYWYQNRIQQTGSALRSFMDAFQERRDQREQREREEISSAFRAIQAMPELVSTWGSDLERKYGQKYPEIPQILAVVRQRHRLAQELPQAQDAYYGALSGLEGDYAAQQERVARMPDAVPAPMPFNPFGGQPAGFIDLPNPNKTAAQRALSEVRPDLFPVDALGKLPPRQRDQARVVLKNQGIELPEQTPFDRFKHLSEKGRGQEAIRLGYIPPESDTAKVLRGEGGLELTPDEEAKQTFADEQRIAREAAQQEQREEVDRLAKERIRLSDDLRAAADRRSLANQRAMVDYRASRRGDRGGGSKDDLAVPWKAIVADSKEAANDWDTRHDSAVKGLEGSSREKAEQAFVAANGRRPKPLGEVAARRIAREVRSRKLEGSDADEAMVEMTSEYMAARARGVGDQEALGQALGRSKARTVAERIRDAKGDEASVYVQLVRDGTTPEEANRLIAEARKAPAAATKSAPSAPAATASKKTAAPKPLFSEVKDKQAQQWASDEYAARIAAGEAPDEAKAAVDALLKQYGKR